MALEVEKLHQQVQMVSGKLSYLEQSIPTEFRDKVVFESKKKELSEKIEAHIKQANQVDALFRQTEKETTRLESTLQSAQKNNGGCERSFTSTARNFQRSHETK